ASRVALFVAEMLRELGARRGLDQPADQLVDQPARTGQVLRRAVVSEQLIEQLLADLCHDVSPLRDRTPPASSLASLTQTTEHPPSTAGLARAGRAGGAGPTPRLCQRPAALPGARGVRAGSLPRHQARQRHG